jgi:hypothetical protein
MNNAAPDPIIPEAEVRLAEARLAAFDRDGLGHSLEALRTWATARASDLTTPCPPPTKLR